MSKKELRVRFRALREGLSEGEVAAASAALCHRLAEWPVLTAATTILTYLAFRHEIDLALLFSLLPDKQWLVPRVVGKQLAIHPYDATRLTRHPYGMLEPAADLPLVDPQTVEVVLVPGVAFDPQGGRLGFGGGFYDDFLPTTPALRVGVTHDCCLANALPCKRHDQRMDWVVTPTRTFHCAPFWKHV